MYVADAKQQAEGAGNPNPRSAKQKPRSGTASVKYLFLELYLIPKRSARPVAKLSQIVGLENL